MKGTRRKYVAYFLLALLLTGCWDRREIEEWSTSLATGVDVCTEGEGCKLVATRQIAIPGRIPLGSASERGGGGGAKETVFVLSTPGANGPDSARLAQATLNRRISFGHSRIVVFSEAFCQRGMADYLDYLRRLPGLRRLMWIAVSEGRAEDVIRAKPALEQVPALFLNDLLDDAVKTGRSPKVFWGEFLTRMSNKGEETIAPMIRMAGPDQPVLGGLAVFRGDRMVGKLNEEETATLMELRGASRGSERLKVQLADDGYAVVTVHGRKTRTKVRWAGGRINTEIDVELESDLSELNSGMPSADPKVVEAIERGAADIVTSRAEQLLKKLQREYRSDILGIGERVRSQMPAVWGSISDWPETFAEARFAFTVTVVVRRGGASTD